MGKSDPYEYLHRLLRGYGVTVAGIQKALGVSRPTATKMLKNPGSVSLSDLRCVCREYGIPIERLREVLPA